MSKRGFAPLFVIPPSPCQGEGACFSIPAGKGVLLRVPLFGCPENSRRKGVIKTEAKFITGTEKKTPPVDGNGYDLLEGEWALFYKIASYFVWHTLYDDREDFLHDTMLEMAKVRAKYEAKGKLLREASLKIVASYELKGYWDKRRYRLFGLNCSHCTTEQRRECRTTRLPSE